jgi:hypothetical protein
MCIQFGFVIYWQKDFSAKAAQKMLVKLIPGVPETDLVEQILLANISSCWKVLCGLFVGDDEIKFCKIDTRTGEG